MKKQDKKRHKHSVLISLILGMLTFLGYLFIHMKPEKRRKLIHRLQDSSVHSYKTLVSYLIPHHSNEYKPHVFQKRSVKNILLLVIAIKIVTVSALFIVYPNQAQLTQDIKAKMYALINDYRASRGEEVLMPNSYLEVVADEKASDMLDNNYFSHFGLDGKKPWQWVDTSMYDYRAMGENLAMDFLSAGSVLKAFQLSPTHDKNLLNNTYSNIGISVRSGYLDGHNTNIMVVFFASPKLVALAAAPQPEEIVEPVIPTPVVEDPVVSVVEDPVEPIDEPVVEPVGEPTDNPEPIEVRDLPEVIQEPTFVVERIEDETAVLGQTLPSNVEIAASTLNSGVVFSQGSLAQRIVAWSDRFLTVTLLALTLLLVINIIVKVRVQHAPVILNAALLIVVVTVLLSVNVHHAENVGDQLRILGSFLL